MRTALKRLCLGLAVVMLSSCATIINRTKQTVFLQTEPPGATAIIDGVQRVETPASIKLKRGKDHHITFEKSGYRNADVMVEKEISGWIWGNLILGGLIGLGIDFISGGAYKLEPETVHVTLQHAQ
jgi:hypothetical protein